MTTDSTIPVRAFFDAFGKGDYEGIFNTFHPEITITAVRDEERLNDKPYGTYKEKEGVQAFLSNLGNTFETQSFHIEHIVGNGEVAFANGTFVHKVKATGKLFPSDWALYVVVKEGKIYEYHFYEDSAKFEAANS